MLVAKQKEVERSALSADGLEVKFRAAGGTSVASTECILYNWDVSKSALL